MTLSNGQSRRRRHPRGSKEKPKELFPEIRAEIKRELGYVPPIFEVIDKVDEECKTKKTLLEIRAVFEQEHGYVPAFFEMLDNLQDERTNFACLRLATADLSMEGPRNGGRSALILALEALRELLIMKLPGSEIHYALTPINLLKQALGDLDRGQLHPALTPAVISHRAPASLAVLKLKGRCLVAMKVLMERGFPKALAQDAVSKGFSQSAGKLGITINRKRLNTWDRELRACRSSRRGLQQEEDRLDLFDLYQQEFDRFMYLLRVCWNCLVETLNTWFDEPLFGPQTGEAEAR